MMLGSDRLTKAAVTFLAVVAVALGADAGVVRAAGDRAPKRATNSLTTQFPLGGQKLCCTSKPSRQATKPARHPPPVSHPASGTSSTAAAVPPRSRTASKPLLLGQRGGSVVAPLIVIGVLIVGVAAAVQMTRLSVRRRRRARRMARAGPATPVAPTAFGPDAAPSPPAHVELKRARSRARSRAPLEPLPHLPPAVAVPADSDAAGEDVIAASAGSDAAEEHVIAADAGSDAAEEHVIAADAGSNAADEDVIAGPPDSDAADEEVVADPLARLEREVLEQGAAASAAAASRRRPPGDGAYRLGQVLYERGRRDEAAAAWRLAAAKQHPKAVARLAELREETSGTDARS